MDARALDLDPESAATLGADGLRLEVVDAGDADGFAAWALASYRGFHKALPDAPDLEHHRRTIAYRRIIGVWDASLPDPEVPVATVSGWVAQLSVPGGQVPSWAISDLTVAPTHLGRGIARALVEGELRTAVAAGIPMASLTATEATLYGRYGFGRATRMADITVDTTRTRWAGPSPRGRVSFVALDELATTGRDAVDRALRATPGEVEHDDHTLAQVLGLDHVADAGAVRGIRYDDESGVPQGVAAYRTIRDPDDIQRHTVRVGYLRAATPDAHLALWKFVLEQPLVASVRYRDAADDDPVLWCLANPRAATVRTVDRHWLRILDVPAVLRARTYAAPVDLVLQVDDPRGFASGVFRLWAGADGVATVGEADPDAAPDIALGVDGLGSLYLGGERPAVLARAGRAHELTPGAVDRLDAAFRTAVPPYLSFDY